MKSLQILAAGILAAALTFIPEPAQAQSGACQMGAKVIDRQGRTGTVVSAKNSDCTVLLEDGTKHYYLAWMLESAADKGKSADVKYGSGTGQIATGTYHCVAGGGIAGTLTLIIKDGSTYSNKQGKKGEYTYDPKTGQIEFATGAWEGSFGKLRPNGKIGIASRKGGFYGTTCELKQE